MFGDKSRKNESLIKSMNITINQSSIKLNQQNKKNHFVKKKFRSIKNEGNQLIKKVNTKDSQTDQSENGISEILKYYNIIKSIKNPEKSYVIEHKKSKEVFLCKHFNKKKIIIMKIKIMKLIN